MAERLQYTAQQELDCVRALDFFVEMLGRVEKDSSYWKWAIVALHNVCHGFMVLALEESWGVGLLPPETREKVLRDKYAIPFDDRVYSKNIMGFMELFERLQDKSAMRQYTDSKEYLPSADITASIDRLNKLRNQHLHFRAETRIDFVPEFVTMSMHVLDVIGFLKNESGNIGWAWSQAAGEALDERAEVALDRAGIRLVELRAFNERLVHQQAT